MCIYLHFTLCLWQLIAGGARGCHGGALSTALGAAPGGGAQAAAAVIFTGISWEKMGKNVENIGRSWESIGDI